jgi:hypothetical protein
MAKAVSAGAVAQAHAEMLVSAATHKARPQARVAIPVQICTGMDCRGLLAARPAAAAR